MNISNFSIKRPVFTLVSMLLIIILGGVSLLKIPITLIPELNPPIGVVVTSYPGASSTEVNEKVTKPLEATLATLPGIKKLQSTSQEGSNLIVLEFNWTTDIEEVQLDILQRIDMTPLPSDAQKPSFLKFDPSQFPIIQLSLRADNDQVDVRILADSLEKELRRTEGVASVNVSGKLIEEVQVTLDESKLIAKGLTQADIIQIIQTNNVSLPGEPVLTADGQMLSTRIISTLTKPEDIADLIVSVNPIDGETLTVGDVATVERAEQKSLTETRANDHPAVLMSVLQESGANTAEVSKAFQQSLNDLLAQEQYKGVVADVLVDQGNYVNLAISNIGSSLLLGGLFAMLVLFVFLRGVKSPIIIGIAIPYSVIVTFVLMYFAHFTLNIMTLGALALGIGMLVDNAIVVIENVERHLGLGKNPIEAAKQGTKEVALAITASTLTTIAVFIPVMFIEGLIGQIFTEFALTISFSLIASLLVALTVVPMLASRLLKMKDQNINEMRKASAFYKHYNASIVWVLKHRFLVILSAVILFGLSVFGLSRIGTEFLPATDEGFASISVDLDRGAAVTKTEQVVTAIEERLKEEQDVDVYVSLIGGTQQSQARGQTSANRAEIYVKLVPLADRKRSIFEFVEEVEKDLNNELGEQADITFNVSTSSGSSPNTLTFRLTDSNEQRLQESVDKVQQELKRINIVTNVMTDLDNTVQEIQIEVDREKAKDYGFLPAQIAQTVNQMTKGQLTTQMIDDDGTVLSVYTGFGQSFNESIESLKAMELRSPAGLFVKLDEIAHVSIQEGPVSIRRSDQAAAVAFFVDYTTKESLGGISKEVDKALEKANLPSETQVVFSGDRELYDSAIDDMLLAVALAVVLVYIVMAAQFESFKYPFVIMFTVPLMIIGVTIAMFATKTLLGVTSVIGILVLVGIVVNNGIVLVDYINQQKMNGMKSYDAILLATQDRLRPILMTALTTILGLLPLALGIGEGTEMNQPMGIAVIGGLITSTLLTLYIVPAVYSLMDKETRRLP
ncbi:MULTISPECIES: efflux RND transporter permease subunit [unclassified Lysinibacillus]|uniref:efflux RND transporter permease subunit n=1 Tax=unclassified Lysinibacillus TaxID=2636778 RepID=UPI00116A1AB3|nr:efflux RND transporter permease subunit [Lysinibacillus sp. CD3-6]QPQ37169.1 efflux RND transporter permease subunit [Lysinibacillus sp. JNUCC-52]UED81036.1 efflux RND transporter permease subunit [Lysinibacillus sp. CD3-6]